MFLVEFVRNAILLGRSGALKISRVFSEKMFTQHQIELHFNTEAAGFRGAGGTLGAMEMLCLDDNAAGFSRTKPSQTLRMNRMLSLETLISWETQFDRARTRAKAEATPVLLDFFNPD